MKIRIEITFGSEFQKLSFGQAIVGALDAMKKFFLSRHKGNKMTVDIEN